LEIDNDSGEEKQLGDLNYKCRKNDEESVQLMLSFLLAAISSAIITINPYWSENSYNYSTVSLLTAHTFTFQSLYHQSFSLSQSLHVSFSC
jgi:hypothetical protein